MADKKYTKYCSFKIDLLEYINITLPNKIFSKHLKYKNNSGTKKAELIFSIKSTEITNTNNDSSSSIINNKILNDRESLISEDESQTTNNTSHISQSSISINNSKTFNELRKTHVANQRKLLHLGLNNCSTNSNTNSNSNKDIEESYQLPTIHRRENKQEPNGMYIIYNYEEIETYVFVYRGGREDDDDEEVSSIPPPFFLHEQIDNNFDQITPISNDTSTAYSIPLKTHSHTRTNKSSDIDIKAGSAISICSSTDSDNDSDDSSNDSSEIDSDNSNV